MKNIIVIVFTLILFPSFSHSTGAFNRCMQWITSLSSTSVRSLSTQEILEKKLSTKQIQQLSLHQLQEVVDYGLDRISEEGIQHAVKNIVENLNTVQIRALALHSRALRVSEFLPVWNTRQQAEFLAGTLRFGERTTLLSFLRRSSSQVLNIVFNSESRVFSLFEGQMNALLKNNNLSDLKEPVKKWITERQIVMAHRDSYKVYEILFFEYVTPKHINSFPEQYREYLRIKAFQASIHGNIVFETLSPTQRKALTMEQIQPLSKEQKQSLAPDLSDYQLYQLSSTDFDIMLDFFSLEQIGILLNMRHLPQPKRQQLIHRLDNISEQQIRSLSMRGFVFLEQYLLPHLKEKAMDIVLDTITIAKNSYTTTDVITDLARYRERYRQYISWLSNLPQESGEAQAVQSLSRHQLTSWYEFLSVEAKRNLSTSQIMDLLPDQLADWLQYLTKEDIVFLENQLLNFMETNSTLLIFLLPYLSLKQREWISPSTFDGIIN